MHPHHRMFGAEVGLFERRAQQPLFLGQRGGRGVVVAVAVQRPQVLGQPFEGSGQFGESALPGVVEVVLAAEEDDPVATRVR